MYVPVQNGFLIIMFKIGKGSRYYLSKEEYPMKKYVSCFLFFFILTSASLITLFLMTAGEETQKTQEVQMRESAEEPLFARGNTEEIHVVLNQEMVGHETVEETERYFLVAEEGYLIVYDKERETTDLFTRMPLAEFPEEEQEKLMSGIWFPTMIEIFSYLESYSS